MLPSAALFEQPSPITLIKVWILTDDVGRATSTFAPRAKTADAISAHVAERHGL